MGPVPTFSKCIAVGGALTTLLLVAGKMVKGREYSFEWPCHSCAPCPQISDDAGNASGTSSVMRQFVGRNKCKAKTFRLLFEDKLNSWYLNTLCEKSCFYRMLGHAI